LIHNFIKKRTIQYGFEISDTSHQNNVIRFTYMYGNYVEGYRYNIIYDDNSKIDSEDRCSLELTIKNSRTENHLDVYELYITPKPMSNIFFSWNETNNSFFFCYYQEMNSRIKEILNYNIKKFLLMSAASYNDFVVNKIEPIEHMKNKVKLTLKKDLRSWLRSEILLEITINVCPENLDIFVVVEKFQTESKFFFQTTNQVLIYSDTQCKTATEFIEILNRSKPDLSSQLIAIEFKVDQLIRNSHKRAQLGA